MRLRKERQKRKKFRSRLKIITIYEEIKLAALRKLHYCFFTVKHTHKQFGCSLQLNITRVNVELGRPNSKVTVCICK